MDQKLMDAGFTEQRFFTGEININYVAGPDNGPTLVFVPAQMDSWESHRPVLLPLSQKFQCFAVDVRGHGKSDWATGNYSWASVGRDMTAFMHQVVKRPAIVSGNSSGGLVALWMAANLPEYVSGIILEDAPVFSTEWPRFRDEDRWVYEGLEYFVDKLGDPKNRDLGDFLRRPVPVDDGQREVKMPGGIINVMSWFVRRYQRSHPGQPVEISWFPFSLRVGLKSLSMFDPDFSRAFVDGRFYEGLDHAKALKRVKCPMLVLRGEWFRHPKYGLVGPMDDQDAARIQELVPGAQFRTILKANHVMHLFKPAEFIAALEEFAAQIEPQPAS